MDAPQKPLRRLYYDYAHYWVAGKNRYMIVGDDPDTYKAALGYLKDWGTALVTLQTAVLTAIGAFVGLKEGVPKIPVLEAAFLIIASGCFLSSIWNAVTMLHQIPGAMQRLPMSREAWASDIYSVAVEGTASLADRANRRHQTIGFFAKRCQNRFTAGLIMVVLFIVVRLMQAAALSLVDPHAGVLSAWF